MRKFLFSVSAVLLVVGLAACGGDSGTDDTNNCDPTCAAGESCVDGACKVDVVTCDPACAEGEDCVEGVCEAGEPEGCDPACVDPEVCFEDVCVVPLECDPVCAGDETCNTKGECIPNEPEVCDPACAETEKCEEGVCVPDVVDACTEVCEGKECGMVDECDCGTCLDGTECNETLYVCECIPTCEGEDGTPFECGDDGCGAECGSCSGSMECKANVCECPLTACDGKDCGPDGCGGTCGECAGDEACTVMGECVAGCDYENMMFSDVIQKINVMEMGKGGQPGEALDVDGDPDTCAPADNCTDGLNNQLSGLLGQLEQFVDADAEIANALAEGSIILLAEMVDMMTDGTEFTMNMYIGELPLESTCLHQEAKCDYLVNPDSYDLSTCLPLIKFDNTIIDDGELLAGGPENDFTISIPIQEGLVLAVTANMAQIMATVQGEGDAMVMVNGLIGGAVRKDKLMEAIDLVPPDALEGLPVSPEMIKNLLNMFVVPDVDEDGDGELDAASIGVKFGTIAGAITGVDLSE